MEIRNLMDDVQELCERAVIRGFLSDVDVMTQVGLRSGSFDAEKMIMDCTTEHYEWLKADTLSAEGCVTKVMRDLVESYLVNHYPSLYFPRGQIRYGEHTAINSAGTKIECIQRIVVTPKRIWRTTGGYTTVEWADGEKTTVKAENEETATEFAGFCAALAKRIFGSTSNVDRKIQEAKWRTEAPARERADKRRGIKIRKQRDHQRRMKAREKAIQDEMHRMQIKREAEKRLEKESEQQ